MFPSSATARKYLSILKSMVHSIPYSGISVNYDSPYVICPYGFPLAQQNRNVDIIAIYNATRIVWIKSACTTPTSSWSICRDRHAQGRVTFAPRRAAHAHPCSHRFAARLWLGGYPARRPARRGRCAVQPKVPRTMLNNCATNCAFLLHSGTFAACSLLPLQGEI